MKYGEFIELEGKAAERFRFLAKAVSDDACRYFLNFIKVEEDLQAVATDSRRLHMLPDATACGVAPGLYKVLGQPRRRIWLAAAGEAAKGVTFPDWQRVLPTEPPVVKRRFSGYRKGHEYGDLFALFYSFPKPTALNLDYLADLGCGDWEVSWWDSNKGLVFDDPKSGLRAMIMTVSLELAVRPTPA